MAKIDKPSNVVLGANQSWNKQHGYVQTDYKHCDKDALKAAYDAAGRPAFLTWIKDQSSKGVAIPSYPTCVAWMETREGASTKTASTASTATASSSIGAKLLADFNANRDKALLEHFESALKDAEATVAGIKGEIRKLKTQMGITDPIVEE